MLASWLTAPLPINYRNLDSGFARIEEALQFCDAIPLFVCTASGMVRTAFAVAQIVMAIVLPLFNLIRGIFAQGEKRDRLNKDAARMVSYGRHGVWNLTLAQVVSVPGLNLLSIPYHQIRGRKKYKEENLQVQRHFIQFPRRDRADSPMPYFPTYARLDRNFAKIEQTLQYFDAIPFLVCAVSGKLRTWLGTIQITIAVSLTLFNTMRSACIEDAEEKKRLSCHTERVIGYAGHGVANLLLGKVVSVPGLNLLTVLYHHGWDRMKYQDEAWSLERSSSFAQGHRRRSSDPRDLRGRLAPGASINSEVAPNA